MFERKLFFPQHEVLIIMKFNLKAFLLSLHTARESSRENFHFSNEGCYVNDVESMKSRVDLHIVEKGEFMSACMSAEC